MESLEKEHGGEEGKSPKRLTTKKIIALMVPKGPKGKEGR